MRSILILGLLVLSSLTAAAQSLPTDTIYSRVDQMPRLTGGLSVAEYIQQNLRYPMLARRNRVEGQVLVHFVVNKDGTIDKPLITQGIGAGCDAEVIRLVRSMPAWEPGRHRGRPVNVDYVLPVQFRLADIPKKTRPNKGS